MGLPGDSGKDGSPGPPGPRGLPVSCSVSLPATAVHADVACVHIIYAQLELLGQC